MTSALTTTLSIVDQQHLLLTAKDSLAHGVAYRRSLDVRPDHFPDPLKTVRATFVTLLQNGQLRGCIGTLEAIRPMIADVAHNAFAAGFHDPRFAPLQSGELEGLEIHISILGDPHSMMFESEEDLITQLRPGLDGLILQEGDQRGTFLPSVWEQLPDPQQFLTRLKVKARLPADYWSSTLKIWRYTTESISS